MSLKTTDISDFLKNGGKRLGELALEIYGEHITQVGKSAFSEAIEIGIENTIASLYEASVEDREVLRIVSEQWGLSYKDVEDRLVWEKSEATIRALKQYLKLQGFSSEEIRKYIIDNHAAIKIRHDADLWKLRKMPQKLDSVIRESD